MTTATVSEYEIAVLVLRYLESKGLRRSLAVFRNEASGTLQSAAFALPPQVKTLHEVLDEYVKMKAADAQRESLRRTNPVATSLYSLLDVHAGLPAPHTLPPAFYAPAQAGGSGVPLFHGLPPFSPLLPQLEPQQAAAAAGGNAAFPMNLPVQPGAGRGVQHTPGRHAVRKPVPPKRRKLDMDAAVSDAAPAFPGLSPSMPLGSAELLELQMQEEGLATLLSDPTLQARFSENLASHINASLPGPSLDADFMRGLAQDQNFFDILNEAGLANGDSALSPAVPSAQPPQQQQQQQQPNAQAMPGSHAQVQQHGHVHTASAVPDPVLQYQVDPSGFEDLIDACIG